LPEVATRRQHKGIVSVVRRALECWLEAPTEFGETIGAAVVNITADGKIEESRRKKVA
jgi:hypothetical protein